MCISQLRAVLSCTEEKPASLPAKHLCCSGWGGQEKLWSCGLCGHGPDSHDTQPDTACNKHHGRADPSASGLGSSTLAAVDTGVNGLTNSSQPSGWEDAAGLESCDAIMCRERHRRASVLSSPVLATKPSSTMPPGTPPTYVPEDTTEQVLRSTVAPVSCNAPQSGRSNPALLYAGRRC